MIVAAAAYAAIAVHPIGALLAAGVFARLDPGHANRSWDQLRMLFGLRYNDVTNAFKAYRAEVVRGCRPLLAAHFNLTVELPLKAVVRGYTYEVIPITWRQRSRGTSNLMLQEMGSRYLFIVLYVWLEKLLTRGDYRRPAGESFRPSLGAPSHH